MADGTFSPTPCAGIAAAQAQAEAELDLCMKAARAAARSLEGRRASTLDPHLADELVGSAWLLIHDQDHAARRAKKQQARPRTRGEKQVPPRNGPLAQKLRNSLRDKCRLAQRKADGGVAPVSWLDLAWEEMRGSLTRVDRDSPEAVLDAAQQLVALRAQMPEQTAVIEQALADALAPPAPAASLAARRGAVGGAP